jgi:hypothetical protein
VEEELPSFLAWALVVTSLVGVAFSFVVGMAFHQVLLAFAGV